MLILLAAVGMGLWLFSHRSATYRTPRHVVSTKESPEVQRARAKLSAANDLYRQLRYRAASVEYREIIRDYGTSADPKLIEQVARARSNLAYAYARRGDFRSAAGAFKQTILACKRSTRPIPMSDTTLADDARLQYAICLNRLSKREEALSAFEALVALKPAGSTARSTCDYIRRLNGGKLTPKAEALLEQLRREETQARKKRMLEQAMCGPKALAYVCIRLGVKTNSKEIAKLAGTNTRGTSMDGLAKAARAKGCSAVGLKVTAKGLESCPMPALALVGGHYMVIELAGGKEVELVDPSGKELRRFSVAEDQLFRYWQGHVLRVTLGGGQHVQVHPQ